MVGYLDIETSFTGAVTILGLLRCDRGLIQITGPAITRSRIEETLEGVDTLCTFYGEGFDLPVLDRAFGLDLLERFRSYDLASECRRRGLRGGLKKIESRLGIPRGLHGLTGYDAMLLWNRWMDGDREALETLLAYNRDDVRNLLLLERRLDGDLESPGPMSHVLVEM